MRIALEPDTDDAWNLYNLLNVGDLIKGSVYRYLSYSDEFLGKYKKKLWQGLLAI